MEVGIGLWVRFALVEVKIRRSASTEMDNDSSHKGKGKTHP